MNGVMKRPVKEEKYSRLLAYYPDTGNPFFQGVFRRYHGGQNPVRMFDPDGTTSLDVGDERMYANLAAADYNNTQAVGSYYWNVYVDPKASNIKTVDNRKYMRVKGSHLELRLDKNN